MKIHSSLDTTPFPAILSQNTFQEGNMLKLIFAVLALATAAQADSWVNGYSRSNGTYVQGYTRSTADNSYNNNYSTRGNSNPYTGQYGANAPTYNNQTPSYNYQHYGTTGTVQQPRYGYR